MEEKIFTIPLRGVAAASRRKRTNKAVSITRAFLERHMKSGDVRIGKSINEALWMSGAQKPPKRIKVHAAVEDGVVYAEMVGVDIKKPTADEAKKKAEKKAEKEKKIKEGRKERKKQTIQEELEPGASQKAGPQEAAAEAAAAKGEEKAAEPGDQTERKDKAISRKTGKG